jgi:mono/diheme cytochrome c family protein
MRHAWAIGLTLATAPACAQGLDATQLTGEHLFNQSCRVCHAKPQFNSAQYGPTLSKASASGDARAMHEVIANGTPRMPGFKYHFAAEQIDAIVAYLMTVPPPEAPTVAPANSRSGAGAD